MHLTLDQIKPVCPNCGNRIKRPAFETAAARPFVVDFTKRTRYGEEVWDAVVATREGERVFHRPYTRKRNAVRGINRWLERRRSR